MLRCLETFACVASVPGTSWETLYSPSVREHKSMSHIGSERISSSSATITNAAFDKCFLRSGIVNLTRRLAPHILMIVYNVLSCLVL